MVPEVLPEILIPPIVPPATPEEIVEVQAKAPVELVTVQPVAPEPPARRMLPVEVAPIDTVPVPLASRVRFSSVPEEITARARSIEKIASAKIRSGGKEEIIRGGAGES